MNEIWNWIVANLHWIFSGLGTAIVIWIFTKKSSKNKQIIKNNSSGIQAGRDVRIEK